MEWTSRSSSDKKNTRNDTIEQARTAARFSDHECYTTTIKQNRFPEKLRRALHEEGG